MKKIVKLLIVVASLISLSGCLSEQLFEERIYQRVVATFDDSDTKVSLNQVDNSLDLIARWQGFEYLNVFCMRNGKYTQIDSPVQVSEISSDGSSAIFNYQIPEKWKEWVKNNSYDVVMFTTPCYPKEKNDKLYFNASIIRESIEAFVAPVYCEGEVYGEESLNALFKHYYAYELLHIKNESDSPIDFSLKGFSADVIWYKTKGSLCLDDGEFVVDAPSTKEPVNESTPITVSPHTSGIIVSAYIPNGLSIKDAKMNAKVNGQDVSSSNTKSSNANILPGHAYHMYATWDGSELKFDETGEAILEAEPSPLDFGEVPVGVTVSRDLTIRNVGNKATSVYVKGKDSGAFTYDELNTTLEAGGETKIKVSFTPSSISSFGSTMLIGTSEDNLWDGIQVRISGEGIKAEIITPDAVDIGLTVKWGSFNIGADREEDPGLYYAWGELEPKSFYRWENYRWCGNGKNDLTKYNSIPDRGVVDNKYLLDFEDDIAHVSLGGNWRMPTEEEVRMLLDTQQDESYQWSFVERNGRQGYEVLYKPNGNYIFLPLTGMYYDLEILYNDIRGETLEDTGRGYFWSSSISHTSYGQTRGDIGMMGYGETSSGVYDTYRSNGIPVRPVYDEHKYDNDGMTQGQIVLERKYWLKHARQAFTSISLAFDNGNYLFIRYVNSSWNGSTQRGTQIFSTYSDRDDRATHSSGSDFLKTEEWVNEKIVLNYDGHLLYYANGELLVEDTFNRLLLNKAHTVVVRVNPYGWWEGHHHYMDDFKITTPAETISDDFNDNRLNLSIWEEPRNPDGVYVEDGMLKTIQAGTDVDYRLLSKPISIVSGHGNNPGTMPVPEAVDLGLPSGIKWASWNLGASSPEECGYYYAWGETMPKETYYSNTYQWCLNGYYWTVSKYNSEDNKTLLDAEDDAACANLGGAWRMPREQEISELISSCDWVWTSKNGVNGYLVKSKTNNNSIFLPACGCYNISEFSDYCVRGYYLSSSLKIDSTLYLEALGLWISADSKELNALNRIQLGLSIRAVYDNSEPDDNPLGNPN